MKQLRGLRYELVANARINIPGIIVCAEGTHCKIQISVPCISVCWLAAFLFSHFWYIKRPTKVTTQVTHPAVRGIRHLEGSLSSVLAGGESVDIIVGVFAAGTLNVPKTDAEDYTRVSDVTFSSSSAWYGSN